MLLSVVVVDGLQGLFRQLHQLDLIAVRIVHIALDALGKTFLHRSQHQSLGSQLRMGLCHVIHMQAQVLERGMGVVNRLIGIEQLNELVLAYTQVNAVDAITLKMLLKHLGEAKVVAVKIHRPVHIANVITKVSDRVLHKRSSHNVYTVYSILFQSDCVNSKCNITICYKGCSYLINNMPQFPVYPNKPNQGPYVPAIALQNNIYSLFTILYCFYSRFYSVVKSE